MRSAGFAVAALCVCASLSSGAVDGPYLPQHLTVKAAIDPGPNVFTTSVGDAGAGSINVFSATDLKFKGSMTTGSMGQTLITRDGKTAYTWPRPQMWQMRPAVTIGRTVRSMDTDAMRAAVARRNARPGLNRRPSRGSAPAIIRRIRRHISSHITIVAAKRPVKSPRRLVLAMRASAQATRSALITTQTGAWLTRTRGSIVQSPSSWDSLTVHN
jgi:hypothetical protein